MQARYGQPRRVAAVAPSLTLAQKLAFAIGGVMVTILAITWLVISINIDRLLYAQAERYGRTLASLTAQSAAEPLLAEDRLQLDVLLNTLSSNHGIRSAAVYTRRGRVLAATAGHQSLSGRDLLSLSEQSTLDGEADRVEFVEPVRFHGTQAGYLYLSVDRRSLEKPLRSSLQKVGVASILMMALATVVAYFLGRWLARPIDRLADATRALREGRYEQLIDQPRDDAIGTIIGTLNDMAQALQHKLHTEKTLSRFVSPAVANQLLGGDANVMQGRSVQATTVFIDMVGFTTLSEKLPAKRVAEVLNFYFALVNRCAKLYHGNVDKYIGDGAMLVFGVPQQDDEHCFHALCCARLFTQVAAALNEQRPHNWPHVEFRVGLHSGEMIAGSMGSQDRMQYTVVGDAVNLAARLSDIGPGNGVLLSEDVLRRADVRSRIDVRLHGSVRLKGKSQDTPCYQLLALADPTQSLIDRQVQHLLAEVDQRT